VDLQKMPSDEHLKKLIIHYRKSLLINPSSETSYHHLAKLYYEYRDLTKALETCQKALSIWPKSRLFLEIPAKILTELGFDSNETFNMLNAFLNSSTLEEVFSSSIYTTDPLNESDQILDLIEKRQSSKVINSFGKTWKDIFYALVISAQESNFVSALDLCDEIIQLEPSLPFPHSITQYELLPKSGRVDSLLGLYSRVTKLSKIHPISYKFLGDILTEKNRISAAILAYNNAWKQLCDQPLNQNEDRQKRTHIDYLVIGIGKGGTSSLYHYLSQHPDIINPFTKEIGFFSEKFHCGSDWYMAQFPPLSFRSDKFVTGETYPWYLGQIDTAERVFDLLPNIKLIAILRNPVSRAISHFYMESKLGTECRSLDQAIKDELAILEGIEDPSEVSHTYWETERGYIWFSLYLPFLKQWMSIFSKDRFLILDSKNLYCSPAKTLNRVFKFLDLAEFESISHPKINQGSYSYSQVDIQLRKTLYDFFYIYNRRLEECLDMNLKWNDEL
jgi:tetratricopeptide (TPR) repeat protein